MDSWIFTQVVFRSLDEATEIVNFSLNGAWVSFDLVQLGKVFRRVAKAIR